MIEHDGIHRPHRRRLLAGAALLAALTLAPPAQAKIPGGFLTQPSGRSSCINEEGSSHCLPGHGFGSSFGLALDPSGQHAYVASFNQAGGTNRSLGSLTVLDRFQTAASLLQPGGPGACFTTGGVDGCTAGAGLLGSLSTAVTPDGRNVYVATQDGLAEFKLDPDTGRATQLPGADGCINEAGSGGCRAARMVQNASSIVTSADSRYVYVAAYGPVPSLLPFSPSRSGVAIFERDADGGLTQLPGQRGCVAEDGASGCEPGPGLLGAVSLSLAPDGQTLYAGAITRRGTDSAGSVAALRVDKTTGDLAPILGHGGCLAEGPVAGCEQARGLLGVTSVVAADEQTVYAVGHFTYSVAVLRRSTDGRLRQPTTGTDGADGCTSASGGEGCATAPSLAGATTVVASHDGFHLYVGGGNQVSVFRRADRGRIAQLAGDFGCIAEGGIGAGNIPCTGAHGLLDVRGLTIDPLDRFVYAATAGNSASANPGGGVVTLMRSGKTPPLTLRARLRTRSCRVSHFVVELSAKSPLPVTISARIDGVRIKGLPKRSDLRLKIRASAYSVGRHRLAARVEDVTGRVRNTALSFRRCASH